MGHSGDANVRRCRSSVLRRSYIAKDGETVTINSPEAREAMEFVKRLYNEAMEPEVLAWDDASNNRCLNAGKCFAIHNPISAYESAKKDQVVVPGTKQPIAEVIDHEHAAWSQGPLRDDRFLVRRHLELLEEHRSGQGFPALPLPAR
jgi:ABC-type glycerol-3-phosphate transport system substrate-binding protein